MATGPRRVVFAKGPQGLGFNLGRAGAYPIIKGVDSGGAAEAAGARANDVILAVNNAPTQGQEQKAVIGMIKAAGAGQITFILQAMPPAAPPPPPAGVTGPVGAARTVNIPKTAAGYGFNLTRVQNLPAIKSVDAGGAAERAGVRNGDIILKINGTATAGVAHADTIKLVKSTPDGGALQLVVQGAPPAGGSLEAQMQQQMDRAATVQDQAKRNHGAEAYEAATGRATLSIAEARERAMAAMVERREEEQRLEKAAKHEQNLQKKYDEIESLNSKLEEVERSIDELTELIQIQRGKTTTIATTQDIKNVDDVLLLIETQAVDELNEQQLTLPQLAETDTAVETAVKEILVKKWEMEVAITRQQLAKSQLSELKRLEAEAPGKKAAKQAEEDKEMLAAKTARERDLAKLAEKKQRVDDLLAAEKAKRDMDSAEATRIKEETQNRIEKEATARAVQAREIKLRWQGEEEIKSNAEEKRREDEEADRLYHEKDMARRNGAAAIAQQEADVEEEKAELQRRTNPHAAFGGAGFKKLEGSTGGNSSSDGDVHPMLALMSTLGRGRKGGLTHLCAPPDTHL